MPVRPLLVEFIGTFFLVFTIGTAVITAQPLAAIAIGAILMTMIYAGGPVSGAHYNPAVTLAVALRRGIGWSEAVGYWISQLLAAATASAVAMYAAGKSGPGGNGFTGSQMGPALVVEALFTFALAYVVLQVATAKTHEGNGFYGVAIGFTVLAGAVSVGGISGGAFNPAVAVGISMMSLSAWSNLWVLIVGDLLGAALAAMVFRVLNPDDVEVPQSA